MLTIRHDTMAPLAHLCSLLCAFLFSLSLCSSSSDPAPSPLPPLRVAIVGCGIGGAATQHFLHEQLSSDYALHIDAFEASDQVGGRIGSLRLDEVGLSLETGASIVHSSNAYMRGFTDLLNLTRQQPKHVDETMAIWDGHEFRLRTSNWSIANLIKLVWRWGTALLKLKGEVGTVAQRFGRFYALQAQNQSFESVQEMLQAVQLYNLTQVSLVQYLQQQLFSPPLSTSTQLLLEELVAALTRVNYNQSPLTINAMAGAVALIPTTGGAENLWQVKEGNVEIVKRLMQRHKGTQVHLSRRVVNVEKSSSISPMTRQTRYNLTTHSPHGETQTWSDYDFIVLAAPLDLSSIDLPFPLSTPPSASSYTHTHTTFINGTVSSHYFTPHSNDTLPGSILTTECDAEANCRFSSLSAYLSDDLTRTTLYKIFSRQPLNDTLLSHMFLPGYRVLHYIDWLAYPAYHPREHLSSFRLYPAENVLSVSMFERAVSVTEGECVSAKNVALLIQQQLTRTEKEERGKRETVHSTRSSNKEEL